MSLYNTGVIDNHLFSAAIYIIIGSLGVATHLYRTRWKATKLDEILYTALHDIVVSDFNRAHHQDLT